MRWNGGLGSFLLRDYSFTPVLHSSCSLHFGFHSAPLLLPWLLSAYSVCFGFHFLASFPAIPFLSDVLGSTPEHLPAGRSQVGNRHLNSRKTGDNLAAGASWREAYAQRATRACRPAAPGNAAEAIARALHRAAHRTGSAPVRFRASQVLRRAAQPNSVPRP